MFNQLNFTNKVSFPWALQNKWIGSLKLARGVPTTDQFYNKIKTLNIREKLDTIEASITNVVMYYSSKQSYLFINQLEHLQN